MKTTFKLSFLMLSSLLSNFVFANNSGFDKVDQVQLVLPVINDFTFGTNEIKLSGTNFIGVKSCWVRSFNGKSFDFQQMVISKIVSSNIITINYDPIKFPVTCRHEITVSNSADNVVPSFTSWFTLSKPQVVVVEDTDIDPKKTTTFDYIVKNACPNTTINFSPNATTYYTSGDLDINYNQRNLTIQGNQKPITELSLSKIPRPLSGSEPVLTAVDVQKLEIKDLSIIDTKKTEYFYSAFLRQGQGGILNITNVTFSDLRTATATVTSSEQFRSVINYVSTNTNDTISNKVKLSDCNFIKNISSNSASSLTVSGVANVVITNSTFENSQGLKGVIYEELKAFSKSTISGTQISNCKNFQSTIYPNGGIVNLNSKVVTFNNCFFNNNFYSGLQSSISHAIYHNANLNLNNNSPVTANLFINNTIFNYNGANLINGVETSPSTLGGAIHFNALKLDPTNNVQSNCVITNSSFYKNYGGHGTAILSAATVSAKNNAFIKNVNTGGSIIYTNNSDIYTNNTFAGNRGLQGPAVTFVQPGYGLFYLTTSFSPGLTFFGNVFHDNRNSQGLESNFNTNKSVNSSGFNAFITNGDNITLQNTDALYTSSSFMQMEPSEKFLNNKYFWKPTCMSPLLNKIDAKQGGKDMFGTDVQNGLRDIGSFEVSSLEKPLLVNSTFDEMRCGSIRMAEFYVNLYPKDGQEIIMDPSMAGKSISLVKGLIFNNGATASAVATNGFINTPSTLLLKINTSNPVNVKLIKSPDLSANAQDYNMLVSNCPINIKNIEFTGTFNGKINPSAGIGIILPNLPSTIDNCIFWNNYIGVLSNSANVSNSRFYANSTNDLFIPRATNKNLKPQITSNIFGSSSTGLFSSGYTSLKVQNPAVIGGKDNGNEFFNLDGILIDVDTSNVEILNNFFGITSKGISPSSTGYITAIQFSSRASGPVNIFENTFNYQLQESNVKNIKIDPNTFTGINGKSIDKINWSTNNFMNFRANSIDPSAKYIQNDIKAPLIISNKDKILRGTAIPGSRVYVYWTDSQNLDNSSLTENLSYSGVSALTDKDGIFVIDFSLNHDPKRRYLRLLQTNNLGTSSIFSNQLIIGCEDFLSSINLAPEYIFCTSPGNVKISRTSQMNTIQWNWSTSNSVIDSIILTNLNSISNPDIKLTVSFFNGCILKDSAKVTFKPGSGIAIGTPVIKNPSCPEKTDGQIQIILSPGSNYSFNWLTNNNSTSPSLINIGAGNYKLLVTDLISSCNKEFVYSLLPITTINYSKLTKEISVCPDSLTDITNPIYTLDNLKFLWTGDAVVKSTETNSTPTLNITQDQKDFILNLELNKNTCSINESFLVSIKESISLEKIDLTFTDGTNVIPLKANQKIVNCSSLLPQFNTTGHFYSLQPISQITKDTTINYKISQLSTGCWKKFDQEFQIKKYEQSTSFNYNIKSGTDTTLNAEFTDLGLLEFEKMNPFSLNNFNPNPSFQNNKVEFKYEVSKSLAGSDSTFIIMTDACKNSVKNSVKITITNSSPTIQLGDLPDTIGILKNTKVVLKLSDSEDNIASVTFNPPLPEYLSYSFRSDINELQLSIVGDIPDTVYFDNLNYVILDLARASSTGTFRLNYRNPIEKDPETEKILNLEKHTQDEVRKNFSVVAINTAISKSKGLLFQYKWGGNDFIGAENVEYNLTITSRWGNIVYSETGKGKNQEWKGEYIGKGISEGSYVADGDYFYIISVKYKSKDKEGTEYAAGNCYFTNRATE